MKHIHVLLTAALVAFGLTSCHNHGHEAHEHVHNTQKLTVYTSNFELYAEMTPLIKGEECKVLAHLTYLSNFKPVDTNKVTLSLSVGNSFQEFTIEKPDEAGKYLFTFVPESAGEGSMMFAVSIADSNEYMKNGHVHVYASHDAMHSHGDSHEGRNHEGHHHDAGSHEGHSHSHEGHNHEGHSHEEGASEGITFTKEQSWKIDFATEEMKPVKFGQLIKTSAQVLPSAGDQRTVSAKASGIVVFGNPNIVEGAAVKAGQRLFSIESNGMADNNMSVRFQEASSNYTLAKQEYERKQKLAADKIVSQSELARAKSELDNAAAIYNNLKGNFSQNGQSLSSPISGYITNIAVQNGGYVEAGQTVVTVSQNRDLYIRAEVQPRYYQALGSILSASFRINGDDKVYSIEDLGGGLVSFGKSASSDDPLIPVTFRFRNSVNLLPGSFVTLYIRTASEEEVITLPNTGLVEEMGTHFVFVQITPEQFEKRPVTLGATDGFRTVIASGLKAGERVVSKGAVMVKLAQGAGALDPHAGHMH